MAGHLLFAVVLSGICLVLLKEAVPEVLDGRLLDTDGYMRMTRVRELAITGDWYDHSISRSNAPYGEVLHWTRPLDVLLLGAAAVARPFTSLSGALHFSALVLSPLLLLLTCFVVGWGSVPLAGREFRYFAMIAVLAQPSLIAYSLPGRPDHHALFSLLFALLFGLTLRWALRPFSRSLSFAAGAVAGAGLWTGPEFLIPIALLLATGAVLWALGEPDTEKKNLWLALGLLGSVAVAVVLEHPPARLLEVEYDRISAPHLMVAALVAVFWGASALLERQLGPGGRRLRARALGLGLGGTAAFVLLYWAYPDFFRGPEVGIDPRVKAIWLSRVSEAQPLLSSLSVRGVGTLVTHLGALGFCAPFLVWAVKKEIDSHRRKVWLLTAMWLCCFSAMALMRIRFAPYAGILVSVVLAAGLSRVLPGMIRISGQMRQTLARAGTSSLVIVGPMFLGLGLVQMGSPSAESSEGPESGSTQICPVSDVIAFLAREDGWGRQPLTIATHLDYGPEILYRTPHRVIGTPYHRNAEGILALFTILANSDLEESRRTALERGVDLVLICPKYSWIYGASTDDAAKPTLHDRLVEGNPPDWLTRVPLPPATSGDMLLYEVQW